MTTTWILVADSARARLFETDQTGSMSELGCYTSAEGRAGTRGLTTDRAPSVNESMGQARHALEPHTSPREKAASNFARSLREVLDRGRNDHRFARLVLVAPPRFLGALHAALDKPLRDAVVTEIRRDFTQMAPAQIRAQIPARAFH